MDESHIKSLIESYVSDSENNLTKENPKFDFKAQWYDLTTEIGIMEFIKDTSAIANTVGLDGYIVIGFNEKSKEFTNASFSDSKFKDTQQIGGLIVKHTSAPYTINIMDLMVRTHKVSVLHMPPSLDKPHCIKHYKRFDKDGKIKSEHKNEIFVRRGSTTEVANRYEIDLMYYDRKNIEPDYLLHSYLTGFEGHTGNSGSMELTFKATLIFENQGKRAISIKTINFEIDNPFAQRVTLFRGTDNFEERSNSNIHMNNLIIPAKTIAKFSQIGFLVSNPAPNTDINLVVNRFVHQMKTVGSAPLHIELVQGDYLQSFLQFKL